MIYAFVMHAYIIYAPVMHVHMIHIARAHNLCVHMHVEKMTFQISVPFGIISYSVLAAHVVLSGEIPFMFS